MIREWIVDAWNGVMNYERNPLRHIPDLQVRHMVMQVLAFMWSGVFALLIADSITVFAYSSIAHIAFITAIVVIAIVITTATIIANAVLFLLGLIGD